VRQLAVTLAMVLAGPAHAACPMELAIYRDMNDIASLEFRPTGEGALTTNTYRILFSGDVVMDGIVIWSDGEARPFGQLQYKCPEGDVTGEEIAACTAWEGVIYSADEKGNIGLLPHEGMPAPVKLILSGLGHSVKNAPAYAAAGLGSVPWDVFELKGCQE